MNFQVDQDKSVTCQAADDSALQWPSNFQDLKTSAEQRMDARGRVRPSNLSSFDDVSLRQLSSASLTDEPLPDLYQEEGSDIGPRCLLDALQIDPLSSFDDKLDLIEAVAAFNYGLVNHRDRHEHEEAILCYESVLAYIYDMMRTSCTQDLPSSTLLKLGMHAHNNLGAIAYHRYHHDDDARANFDAALLFAQQLSQRVKHENLAIAAVLSNWCRVHWMRGDMAADALFAGMQEILRLRSESLPWYHADVAAAHFNLAAAHHARGQVEEALSHLGQYLEIATHHSTTTTNNNNNNINKTVQNNQSSNNSNKIDPIPALIYLLLIRYEDKEEGVAQELTRGLRTLQDKRQEQGNASAEVASVLNYVGTLLFHCKEFDNALLFFQEELRIEERLDEHDRVSLSVTCNNVGRTLQELGKLREAMVYYKRALKSEFSDASDLKSFLAETRRNRDPTTTNLFSTVWYNLGLIHDKLGDATEAINAFQISLNLRKLILGPMHPDIACLWYNIGVLQMERDFLNDANASFRQALAIRATCQEHQLNDARVMQTLQKLSSLQKAKGDLHGAISSLEQIGALLQQSTSFHTINLQKEISSVYFKIAELHHDLDDMPSSFVMANAAVQAVQTVTPLVLRVDDSEVSSNDKLAAVEQWAMSHLLVGSLFHENGESHKGYLVLQQIVQTMEMLTAHPLFSTSSLLALRQVMELLATPQCAPSA